MLPSYVDFYCSNRDDSLISVPKLDHFKLSPATEISCSEAFLNTDKLNNTQKISVAGGKLR